MIGRCRSLLLLFLFIINITPLLSQRDSLSKRKHILPKTITYSNNFSACYARYKNWKYGGYNNYSFLVRSNINYDTIGNRWESHICFNGEIGYMKFADSSWYKNNDFLNVNVEMVKNKGKKIENVFTFYFDSQFLSGYENSYNSDGTYTKKWMNGFGNPMNVDLGYGATIHFWKTSRISLTFVTLRTSTVPLQYTGTLSDNDILYKKTIITSEYGISIQTFIRKNIGSHVRWENNSRFFANAINRNKFDIDFKNRLIIRILKYMDFIIDTHVRYMPYPPYKFQFRNELMLSFTFEKI